MYIVSNSDNQCYSDMWTEVKYFSGLWTAMQGQYGQKQGLQQQVTVSLHIWHLFFPVYCRSLWIDTTD